MNAEPSEFSEDNTQTADDQYGIDSLALMLLSSFLSELFVYLAFYGKLSRHDWLLPHNLPTSFILWLLGANGLFVIWFAFWLFSGRIMVPKKVFIFIAILAIACGGAVHMRLFETKTLAIILPAVIFVSHLFFALFLTPRSRIVLGAQVFISCALGIAAGILHIYLYVTAML